MALSIFFAIIIAYILKMNLKLIRGGLFDETIKKQQEKEKNRTAVFVILEKILSTLFLLFSISVFALSLEIKINENQPISRTAIKVVVSQSMSAKDPGNTYLFENNLNNQVDMFDLIVMKPLPKEEELKLYDIVIYETQGQMILHRIIEIKEPDEIYLIKRYIFKGDANKEVDKTAVLYSQMRGIYKGSNIKYIGSFIIFINSPAGYLCIFLIVLTLIVYPIIDKKLNKEIAKRLAVCEKEKSLDRKIKDSKEINFVIKPKSTDKDSKVIKIEDLENSSFDEKVSKLNNEQEDYYLEISLHASLISGVRRIKKLNYEEYKIDSKLLIRFEIHNGIIKCLFNQNLNSAIPASIDIKNEKSLNTAKDFLDLSYKKIKENRSLKKINQK